MTNIIDLLKLYDKKYNDLSYGFSFKARFSKLIPAFHPQKSKTQNICDYLTASAMNTL